MASALGKSYPVAESDRELNDVTGLLQRHTCEDHLWEANQIDGIWLKSETCCPLRSRVTLKLRKRTP